VKAGTNSDEDIYVESDEDEMDCDEGDLLQQTRKTGNKVPASFEGRNSNTDEA